METVFLLVVSFIAPAFALRCVANATTAFIFYLCGVFWLLWLTGTIRVGGVLIGAYFLYFVVVELLALKD